MAKSRDEGGVDAAPHTVLRSPALYLGEVALPAPRPKGRRVRSARALKNFTFPLLHWLARHAPPLAVLVPVRFVAQLARWAYRWRANPLRRAVEHLAAVAARKGIAQDPRQTYNAYLSNACATVAAYLALEREGLEAAVGRTRFHPRDRERINALLAEHEGAILAVAHNFGSVYAAARLSQALALLVISKNSSTVRRTQMTLEVFERMKLRVLMVRGGNPVALSRAIFRALKDRLALAATVENVERGKGAVAVQVFGVEVGFSPWAASIAAKRGVPVVPIWFANVGDTLEARLGEALVADDARRLVQHYVGFFEQQILGDPASWAYLADKHWRAVLERAAKIDGAGAPRGDTLPQGASSL